MSSDRNMPENLHLAMHIILIYITFLILIFKFQLYIVLTLYQFSGGINKYSKIQQQ